MRHSSIIVCAFILAATSQSYAQQGSGNGGGGEIIFHNLSAKVSSWLLKKQDQGSLEQKLHLNGTSVTGAHLVSAYQNAVISTPDVKFIPEAGLATECASGDVDACMLAQNNSRICMNHQNPNFIRCNEDEFMKSQGNIRYAIVFHEYLGVAGIETNGVSEGASYSQYPISKYIIDFAQPKIKTSVDYELVMDDASSGDSNIYQYEQRTLISDPGVLHEHIASHSKWELLGGGYYNGSTYDCKLATFTTANFTVITEVDGFCSAQVVSTAETETVLRAYSYVKKTIQYIHVDSDGKMSLGESIPEIGYEFKTTSKEFLVLCDFDCSETQNHDPGRVMIYSGVTGQFLAQIPLAQFEWLQEVTSSNRVLTREWQRDSKGNILSLQLHLYDFQHEAIGSSEKFPGWSNLHLSPKGLTVVWNKGEAIYYSEYDLNLKMISRRILLKKSPKSCGMIFSDGSVVVQEEKKRVLFFDEQGRKVSEVPGMFAYCDVPDELASMTGGFNFIPISPENSNRPQFFNSHGMPVLKELMGQVPDYLRWTDRGVFQANDSKRYALFNCDGRSEGDCSVVDENGKLLFSTSGRLLEGNYNNPWGRFLFVPKAKKSESWHLKLMNTDGQVLWTFQDIENTGETIDLSDDSLLILQSEANVRTILRKETFLPSPLSR